MLRGTSSSIGQTKNRESFYRILGPLDLPPQDCQRRAYHFSGLDYAYRHAGRDALRDRLSATDSGKTC